MAMWDDVVCKDRKMLSSCIHRARPPPPPPPVSLADSRQRRRRRHITRPRSFVFPSACTAPTSTPPHTASPIRVVPPSLVPQRSNADDASNKLSKLREDLEYVKFFPKNEKYFPLFTGGNNPDVVEKRNIWRKQIKENLMAAAANGKDLEENQLPVLQVVQRLACQAMKRTRLFSAVRLASTHGTGKLELVDSSMDSVFQCTLILV